MKQHQRAFTLIEVLVALVILAVLGLMSWRALSAALDSRDHILGVEQRWQRIARALSTVETHLLQISTRNNPAPNAVPDFQLILASTGEQRLVFLRMDSEQGARVSGFEFKDNALQLLRWPARIYSVKTTDMTSEPLLDGVSSLRWAVYDDKGTADDISDDEWVEKWNQPTPPRGVRLRIDVNGVGTVEKLYAIR
ncbi:type II secretion system protein GspJ [Viridibacterium curvum]|uniref:Type II secretion system protein J n=1 Tax=Viridibacterium curvum TaxID=1101404 RepID=A0ABP9QCX0_9RHOO